MQPTRVWTTSHLCRILLNKVYVCCLFFLFLLPLLRSFLRGSESRDLSSSSTEADLVLLDHHAAAELLLRSQTQLLQVGLCAGGRAQAPHRRFGYGGEGALCCRLGLLLEARVGVGECLLADVQTSLEKVSSGGHGGQGGGVAA